MVIWCSRNISYYHQCWNPWCCWIFDTFCFSGFFVK